MKRVKATASFGYCNAYHVAEFEFENDATPNEMMEEIWDWAVQYVAIDFEVIGKGE